MTLGEYRLLHHWTSSLSFILSVAPKTEMNPFQMHITAMAFEKGPLRYTILSMAARHLAVALDELELGIAAQKYQQQGIQYLSQALRDPVESCSDSTLASILMMQVSASFSADDEPRANHLLGAKWIITQRGGPSACSESRSRFLLSLFTYHDVLSSISKGEKPMLDHNYSPLPGADELMGCTTSVLSIVSQISDLQSLKKAASMDESGNQDAELPSTGMVLEAKLKTWKAPSTYPMLNQQTAEAYRHAALIYLYRVIYNIGAPHPLTLSHVRKCLDSLGTIPSQSSLASIHVWPLFTAGCESVSIQDREFVCQRFQEMYAQRRMLSLKRVQRAIEDVWADKDQEASHDVDRMVKLDCIDAIKSRGKQVDIV
jgi:hypothetical protein